jgi:hypothetical protein
MPTPGPGHPTGPIIVPMSWLGRLTLPPLAGAPGGAPAGPAVITLRAVAARMAAIIRCIGVAYVVVQVIIWHPFYEADPWRLAGPVAAAAWGAAVVVYLRLHWPPWQLTALDAGAYLVLALCAGWCVPPAIRGEAASWLFIAMASQLVVPAWFAQAVVSAPLALAGGAAFWAGTLLAQAGGFGGRRQHPLDRPPDPLSQCHQRGCRSRGSGPGCSRPVRDPVQEHGTPRA